MQKSRCRLVRRTTLLLIRGSGSAARRWRRTEPSVQSCVFACETSTDAAGRRAPAVHSGSGGVRRNEPDQPGDGEHRAAGDAGGAAAVTATPRPTTTSERGRVARVRVSPGKAVRHGNTTHPVRPAACPSLGVRSGSDSHRNPGSPHMRQRPTSSASGSSPPGVQGRCCCFGRPPPRSGSRRASRSCR